MTNEVSSVKVLLKNPFIENATWKAEEDMKVKYPHLFVPNSGNVEGTNSILIPNFEFDVHSS